jgi:hypothetical protein
MNCGETTAPKLVVDGIKVLLKSLYSNIEMMGCESNARPIPAAFDAITSAYTLKHDRLFLQHQADQFQVI